MADDQYENSTGVSSYSSGVSNAHSDLDPSEAPGFINTDGVAFEKAEDTSPFGVFRSRYIKEETREEYPLDLAKNFASMIGPFPIRSATANNFTPQFTNAKGDTFDLGMQDRKDGKQKFTLGRSGRILTELAKIQIETYLQKVFLENYDKCGIINGSSTLRKAVQQGTFAIEDADSKVHLAFTIAGNLERPQRTFSSGKMVYTSRTPQAQRNPQYYGPIVFGGRGAIVAPHGTPMIYKSGNNVISKQLVGLAEPRNPFALDEIQIANLIEILRSAVRAKKVFKNLGEISSSVISTGYKEDD